MTAFAISIDIGSTWTKGISVDLDGAQVVERRATATTTDNLERAFNQVYQGLVDTLRRKAGADAARGAEIFLSSSAKGGLGIIAIGLVPELTVRAAKMAAACAGGKIIGTYAYKLSDDDVKRIEAQGADIILLTGGTDGGDGVYILHNAEKLARSAIRSAVVYAGNRNVQAQALEILCAGGKEALGADNILPELDRIDIDSARSRIADLFIKNIIRGRGLQGVKERCSADPRPTPAAVYDFAQVWGETEEGLLILDMGGATTDVYSVSDPFQTSQDRLYRGLPEGRVKRTVEGDLGLRWSALHTAETGKNWAERILGPEGAGELLRWARRAAEHPEIIPQNAEEQRLDDFLAQVCVGQSIRRHGGVATLTYTATGPIWLQNGKDLSLITTIIGSGGRLAQGGSFSIVQGALRALAEDEGAGIAGERGYFSGGMAQRALLPRLESIRYFRDAEYLIPLAANLVKNYPSVAVQLIRPTLQEEQAR
jgi:uncharacterized protein (TIGR01319 family)